MEIISLSKNLLYILNLVVCWSVGGYAATDEFQLVVIVSNGLGNGQSVTFPTSVPRISTDIVSTTVSVRESMANISGTLPSTFMGSTALTLNYTLMSGGVVFSETSPSVGRAGQTLTVTLTNLQVGVPYTYSVFVTHGSLLVEVTATFSSECREEDLQGSGSSTNPMCTSGGFMGGVRIANGDTCYTGTNPNSQPPHSAQTFCDVGYELSLGSAVRTCQSDGTWSGSSSVCTELATPFPVWVIVIIVIVLVIIIVAAGLGGVYCCYEYKKGSSSSQVPAEMGPVYEDPDEVKPDPNTEGNIAYGHVQPWLNRAGHSRRGTGQSSSQPPTEMNQVGPIYEEPEDFKPDPNTEGNVACGHVQPQHHRQ